MKTKLLIILTIVFLFACKEKSSELITPQIGPENENHTPDESLGDVFYEGACMVVVKFEDKSDIDKILIGNIITEYNSNAAYGEYKYDSLHLGFSYPSLDPGMGIEYKDMWCTFAEEQLSILSIKPYIELTDDYFLIDWRWKPFLQISTTAFCASPQAVRRVAFNHSYILNSKWEQLQSIKQIWQIKDTALCQRVKIDKLHMISYEDLNAIYHFNHLKSTDYNLIYTNFFYYGMRVPSAYEFFSKNDPRFTKYVSFCDSMQDVYKNILTAEIKKYGVLHYYKL